MSGQSFTGATEDDSARLTSKHLNPNHSNGTQSPRSMPISWLEGRKNWPDHAERKLENFMDANNFFHYKSTQTDSCRMMDQAVSELQALFDDAGWDESIHPEKLKVKVCNKMHRIRAKKNALAEFYGILRKLPTEAREEAVRAMVGEFGKEMVRAGLDETDWMDLNFLGDTQAGII